VTVRRDLSTPGNREFWDAVSEAARVVDSWPAWKRNLTTYGKPPRAAVSATERETAEMDETFVWDPGIEGVRAEKPTPPTPVLERIGLCQEDREKVEECLQKVDNAPSGQEILMEGIEIISLLLSKNESYGDSALRPVRIFSKSESTEQIRVRIDDKLSRMARGNEGGEDVVKDLIGYLILLRIAERE